MMRYNAAMIKPIKTYSLEELQQLMEELDQLVFRAKQLYEWLYLHNASSYDEMTNLRELCVSNFPSTIPFSFPMSWILKLRKMEQQSM